MTTDAEKIDWEKELESDHGRVTRDNSTLAHDEKGGFVWVTGECVHYSVRLSDGVPFHKYLPDSFTVRNKPEPVSALVTWLVSNGYEVNPECGSFEAKLWNASNDACVKFLNDKNYNGLASELQAALRED